LQSIKPNQDLLQKAVIKLREWLNGFEAEVLVGLDCYSPLLGFAHDSDTFRLSKMYHAD
jgi:hypothetical protein